MNRYLKYGSSRDGCRWYCPFHWFPAPGPRPGGHASVGLGHGEEGYLHLQEMVKHLEFSLKMPDASEELKTHAGVSLKARQRSVEALRRSPQTRVRIPGPSKNAHDE